MSDDWDPEAFQNEMSRISSEMARRQARALDWVYLQALLAGCGVLALTDGKRGRVLSYQVSHEVPKHETHYRPAPKDRQGATPTYVIFDEIGDMPSVPDRHGPRCSCAPRTSRSPTSCSWAAWSSPGSPRAVR